jgi:hypothetical protein
MRAKTINETQNFERGINPKESMNIGGFNLGHVYNETILKAEREWKKYLDQFIGKRISFVIAPNNDGLYSSYPSGTHPGERISITVKSWDKNGHHIWVIGDDYEKISIDINEKVYIIQDES